ADPGPLDRHCRASVRLAVLTARLLELNQTRRCCLKFHFDTHGPQLVKHALAATPQVHSKRTSSLTHGCEYLSVDNDHLLNASRPDFGNQLLPRQLGQWLWNKEKRNPSSDSRQND